MRLAAIVALGFGLAAPASCLSPFRRDQSITRRGDDPLKIPGDNPLTYCDAYRDDNVIQIESVDLLPNPPLAGAELVIKAVGTVFETIEKGAYVNLQVKYGLIRLINTQADLCEQIKNVDLECPIEKGVISIIKTVELPGQIPPGKYSVVADVFTKDDEPVTCLKATVTFGVSNTYFEL